MIGAIADAEEKDVCRLNLALREVINPEAINQLGQDQNTDWQLEFVIGGHEVTVSGRGIMIDGQWHQ